MINFLKKKDAHAVSIIGGADGPTSIFFASKKEPRTLWQKMQAALLKQRKKRIAGAIKANPHTMEQTAQYAHRKWGYQKVSRDSDEYKMVYAQLRTSSMLEHQPELLGEYQEFPKPERQDEESMKRYMVLLEEFIDRQQKAAEAIPKEQFDIELCILRKEKNESDSSLVLERRYGYISSSSSGGDKRSMKEFQKKYQDILRYYGVSQQDIDQKTKRYEYLLRELAMNWL